LTLIWSVLAEKAQTKENPFAWDKKARKGIHRRSIKAEAHQRRKRPLTIKEIDEVLKKAKGDYRTLIMILVCTGQRLVDGLKLEWKAIDFGKRIIKLIPQKTSKRTGTAVYIPLFPQLEVELMKRKKRGRYVLPKLVEQYNRDASSVSKQIKEICTDADIKTAKETELETGRVVTDVGAHSLRHTFVTIARMAGLPDPMIRQITGHSSQEMVDHYTQFSEEMVATLAGKLLGPAGTQKALSAPFSEAAKEPVPAWVKAKVKDVAKLVGKITGKTNAKSKAAILEALNGLA
jgi:integrase